MRTFTVLFCLTGILVPGTWSIACPIPYTEICGWSQQMCAKGVDDDGCDLGSYCMPINTHHNNCDEHCPCQYPDLDCHPPPKAQDPPEACHEAPWCIPRTHDMNGNECPQYCPNFCEHMDMTTCPSTFDSNGCEIPGVCVDHGMELQCDEGEFDSHGCPIIEHVDCGALGLQSCGGAYLEGKSGCMGPEICVEHDAVCPLSNVDANGCRIYPDPQCTEDQEMCSEGFDERGCELPRFCMSSYSPDGCPVCPAPCGHNEMPCCGPDGCPSTLCVEAESPDGCPGFCPTHCSDGSIPCPGFHDHRGCPLPDTCVPETEQCPSEIGMYDQQGCLIHEEMLSTAPNEIVCHETDMHTGCQKAPQLVVSANPDCEPICPTTCSHDEALCPGGFDAKGCPLPDTCVPPTFDHWGDRCWHEDCPAPCDQTWEMECPSEYDEMGCPVPRTCIPMPKGGGSDGCPAFCPVTCAHQYATPCQDITDGCVVNEFCAYGSPSPIYQSEMCQAICPANCDPATEMECPGGYDHMGCEQPSSCVPIHDAAGGPMECPAIQYDHNGCYNHGELTCAEDEQICSQGWDERGCELGRHCQPNYFPCDQACHEPYEMSCPGFHDPHSGLQAPAFCQPATYQSDKGRLCHAHCDADCGTDNTCPGEFDSDGCRGPSYCVPQGECCYTQTTDSRGCPLPDETDMCYGMSPACPGNLETCYGHYDYNGCEVPAFCALECPNSEYDDRGCWAAPDPECGEFEIMCDMGIDSMGCWKGYECHPMSPGNCHYLYGDSCPQPCDETVEWSCSGYWDERTGCQYPDICVPHNEPCPSYHNMYLTMGRRK